MEMAEEEDSPVLNPFNTQRVPRRKEENMAPSGISLPSSIRHIPVAIIFLALLACSPMSPAADSAYVRVNQAGYETGMSGRAYLMSTAAETGATFQVMSSKGAVAYAGKIGALLGTWSHSKTVTYEVYALDFTVPGGDIYNITVSGPVAASSPDFAVDSPERLYSGLLLNTLFFYESERDGKNFDPNALRAAPGHLKDENATVYDTPPLDVNDFINNVPPAVPLMKVGV